MSDLKFADAEEQSVWLEIFLVKVKRGAGPVESEKCADHAIEAWRDRKPAKYPAKDDGEHAIVADLAKFRIATTWTELAASISSLVDRAKCALTQKG